jgi:hypothetical protein
MTLYRMAPDVEALILSRRRSGRARLVTMTVEVVRRLPDEPLFRRVIDVDPELLLPYLTDRIGSTQRLAIGHVRRVIAEGQADGSVRRCDLDVMATALLVAVAPFVISARLLDAVGRDAALAELARGLDGWLAP